MRSACVAYICSCLFNSIISFLACVSVEVIFRVSYDIGTLIFLPVENLGLYYRLFIRPSFSTNWRSHLVLCVKPSHMLESFDFPYPTSLCISFLSCYEKISLKKIRKSFDWHGVTVFQPCLLTLGHDSRVIYASLLEMKKI